MGREVAMNAKSASPGSRQRLHIIDAYRGRGRRNNNLFLVYSVKTNRDWILPSDRQFIHWIHCLETDPQVKTFDLAPELVISTDAKEIRGTQLDAEVLLQDGAKEWHEVKSAESEVETARSQLLAQAAASSTEGVKYRIFTDRDFHPHIQTSIRWLRAIAFAAAIRKEAHPRETFAMATALERLGQGTVREVLSDLSGEGWDEPVLLGVFVRLAINGMISLDLANHGFSYGSPWIWNGNR